MEPVITVLYKRLFVNELSAFMCMGRIIPDNTFWFI